MEDTQADRIYLGLAASQWKSCTVCGCLEPFQGLTDECCFTRSGGSRHRNFTGQPGSQPAESQPDDQDSQPAESQLTARAAFACAGAGAHGMAGNLDAMRKPDLMKYAASLGVATRKEGTKQWRQVADVRADCKLREAAQQQHSSARAGGPGSASSSQATPSTSSTGAPTQAVQQKQALAHAGGPGSASSTQAAPSAPSREAPTQAAPAAGVGAGDVEVLRTAGRACPNSTRQTL